MRRLLHPGAALAVLALIAVGAGAGLSGCAGGPASPAGSRSASPRPIRQPKAIADCGGSELAWRPLHGAPVTAAVTGAGPTVVLANDAGNSLCEWLPFAGVLAGHYRLALFDYSSPADPDRHLVAETLGVARAAAGGGPYALVGASIGARLAIEAAATHPAGLAAIVSLSPRRGDGLVDPDILPEARKVTSPALMVTALDDGSIGDPAAQRLLHQALHGSPSEFLQISGTAHGVDLLAPLNQEQRSARDRVVNFLGRQLAAR